jgi:hypothetical protein
MFCDEVIAMFRYMNSMPRKLPGSFIPDVIAEAEKFELDDRVCAAAGEIASGPPSAQLEIINNTRLPYPITWIEFNDAPRKDAYRRCGVPVIGDNHPTRVGILFVENGKRTDRDWFVAMMVFWRSPASDPANAIEMKKTLGFMPLDYSPMMLGITNDEDPRCVEAAEELIRINMGPVGSFVKYAGSQKEREILPHYMARATITRFEDAFTTGHFDENMAASLTNDVVAEYSFGPAAIMLINSTKATARQFEDMTKLNRSREKAGKAPLSSYTRVSLIGRDASGPQYAFGGDRNPARAHTVRGHFKRLFDAEGEMRLAWWSPHVRGGAIAGTRRPGYKVKA